MSKNNIKTYYKNIYKSKNKYDIAGHDKPFLYASY